MSNDGKRQSSSQRIGTVGERIFQLWASKAGLTADKVAEDFGIDFYCRPVGAAGVVSGTIIAVQVRSTEAFARKRIELDRSDVLTALGVEIAYCLVGVDIVQERVGFKFLDEQLLAKFHEFLRSERETWSMRFRDLPHGQDMFRDELTRIATPGVQQRLRLLHTQEVIKSDIPGAHISVSHGDGGSVATVAVPWLPAVFEVEPAMRETVLRTVLIDGEIPHDSMPGLRLKSDVLEPVFRLGDGEQILVGGPFSHRGALVLSDALGECRVPVMMRAMDGDVAFATSTGLVIRFSRGEHTDSDSQDFVEWALTTHQVTPLGVSRDELIFLRRLRPSAKLRVMRDVQYDLSAPLARVGERVEALELICSATGLTLSDFILADIFDEELILSITVLESIARGVKLPEYLRGFVVGEAATAEIWPHHNATYMVPVVANLKQRGVVAWLRGRCRVSLREGKICGFKPLTQDELAWLIRERLPTGGRPQLWFSKDWGGIDILEVESLQARGIGPAAHPCGGTIWLDR